MTDNGDDVASTAMTTEYYNKIKGWYLYQITTDPGTTGMTNGAWDFNLTVAGGTDNLLGGICDNRSSTLTQKVLAPTIYCVDELLYFDTDDNLVDGGIAVVEILFVR